MTSKINVSLGTWQTLTIFIANPRINQALLKKKLTERGRRRIGNYNNRGRGQAFGFKRHALMTVVVAVSSLFHGTLEQEFLLISSFKIPN